MNIFVCTERVRCLTCRWSLQVKIFVSTDFLVFTIISNEFTLRNCINSCNESYKIVLKTIILKLGNFLTKKHFFYRQCTMVVIFKFVNFTNFKNAETRSRHYCYSAQTHCYFYLIFVLSNFKLRTHLLIKQNWYSRCNKRLVPYIHMEKLFFFFFFTCSCMLNQYLF